MNRLVSYLGKYAWCYIIAISAMVISIALDMFNPRLMKVIIDDVIIGGNMDLFKGAILGLLGITLGRALFGYTKELLFDYSSSKLVMALRQDLFDHIQKLSFSFFDGMNTGELMSRIKEDIDNVWHAAAFGVMVFIEQCIYFVTASVLLFTLNWKLALVSLSVMPLMAWLAIKLEKKIGKAYDRISDQRAVINTIAQENLAGVRLVKAFGREKYEISKFLEQNKKSYQLNLEQASVWAKYFPGIEFLTNLVLIVVTTVGGFLVIGEEMTLGTLVAFSSYINMLIWPMRQMGWLTNLLAQCNASMKKLDTLFSEEPVVKGPENPVKPEKVEGHLVFEHVSFEYNGVPVLKDICIDAKPGATVAIMGMTGAGKTSLVNLIGRYYDTTSGCVCLEGTDVRQWDLKELRRQVSVVMQDTFLFSDTIEENIKFGVPELKNSELLTAAKDARVHPFVMQMADGYETVIGERGVGLSGGQKQRLSIARALAGSSRILVLDDATSALDMETEYQIQKALEKRKDITKFIIAHRISAVKNADEILMVEDGCIVERGTHRQLLEKKGRYYETYCAQFQGYIGYQEAEVV